MQYVTILKADGEFRMGPADIDWYYASPEQAVERLDRDEPEGAPHQIQQVATSPRHRD